MNGLRARGQRSVNDGLPAQIAVLGRAATNMHSLVAQLHVARAGVSVRIHSHGLDAQAGSGGRHTASDFATVGDEDFGEHRTFQSE